MVEFQKAPDEPEIDPTPSPQDEPIGDDQREHAPDERLPQKNPTDPEYS
ncbi:hypothetical protein VPH49_23215 [Pseudomonas luteola]|uniref:Uncharacterized protein n=1 Tax=Pseudomonas luteola TaxID=47886 RepID=A0ABS0MYX5_PSELU|nr:hypothetical protein [Pseudomonas luteola]MBH3441169.1 hypothetical protein [Pseudomonas luteola]